MHEQILTPKLLAQLAEVRSSQQRYMEAADLLAEATDLLEGLLTCTLRAVHHGRAAPDLSENLRKGC
jgi:hypothetical protein